MKRQAENEIVKKVFDLVKKQTIGEASGHDWWHAFRVYNNSIYLGKKEKGNLFIIKLAALLHDLDDWKLINKKNKEGKALKILKKAKVEEGAIKKILHITKNISFKGVGVKNKKFNLEGKIVQDADRLDAIGAIGIARVFAYGGHKGREIYNPGVKPVRHKTFGQYKKNNSSSINHFYEKLLFLKRMMNTATAKKMAASRHKLMELYLDEFFKEWKAKK